MQTNPKSKIAVFLARHMRPDCVTDDADLFAGGYVNSLFAMQLILFVEKEFGVHVENEDLKLANFRTLSAIDAFVQRKQVSPH